MLSTLGAPSIPAPTPFVPLDNPDARLSFGTDDREMDAMINDRSIFNEESERFVTV